jgi:ACS family hexuronate transporter-like MFS transporter
MFPRHVVGSVTGFGGFAGSFGAMALFLIVGRLRAAAVARHQPGDYLLIFLAASLAYLLALLLVHLLAPRLEPANLGQGPPPQPLGAAQPRPAPPHRQ